MAALLDGKVVIVTGAGQGLGRSYARLAARSGATAVVNDLRADLVDDCVREINASGGRAIGAAGTAATWEGAHAIVSTAVEAGGRLDAVINNAGAFVPGKAGTLSESEVRLLLDVNLNATLYVGAAALPIMVAAGGGSVINVVSGAIFGQRESAFYGAAKAGVLGATYGWAFDHADDNVRCNAISPLATGTGTSQAFEARFGRIENRADPDAVAPLAIFLASDLAADVTGQVFRFDHGSVSLLSRPAFGGVARRDSWEPADLVDYVHDHRWLLEPLGFSTIAGVSAGSATLQGGLK